MKYHVGRAAITLSVRELCAYAVCPPDLDLRIGGRQSLVTAAKGREAHKLLQKRAEHGYEAEVAFTNTTLHGGICYEVSGRADGVLRGDPTVVEEIKTVSGSAFDREPTAFHEAQGMCYAYFLCRRDALAEVEVRLTLCRVEDYKTRSFARRFGFEELERFYRDLLARVEYRARLTVERYTVRIPSVSSGRFPFSSVREGQDIMIRESYRDIKAGKRLFLQAPTGTGKTVSSLYPAVRALGDGYCDKIFYLTAKASTRREAYAASSRIFEAGSHLRTVVLTAREQICPNEEAKNDPAGISRHCNPEACPRARGFYEKCGAAMMALMRDQNGFPRASIEDVAKRFGICPYEFQLELSELCDIVICDYNYVFDPLVYLRRFFATEETEKNNYVFLIDEAHNLRDRACDMYSASLSLSSAEEAYREAILCEEELAERLLPLEKLIVTMHGFKRLCEDNLFRDDGGREHGYYVSKTAMLSFDALVREARAAIEKLLFLRAGAPYEASLTVLASVLRRYETVAEVYDSHFLTFVEVRDRDITAQQICLDPSRVLDFCMNRARATVLFSATMTPLEYFADILGGGKGAVRISLPSPFDPENVCLAVGTGVDVTYEGRDASVKRIASHIAAAISARAGNYIVYFPSYAYMEKVHEAFCKRYPDVPTVLQARGMSAKERDAFLDAFADDHRMRVGFCVLGGSFSEGVDLPGGRLIGTVIVGVGLPGISNERNILKEYYDTARENGYDYAYTYPGMNRVLQAAGRVIRRESDCGVIVLLDERYAEPRYRALFPDHWQNPQYAGNASELANITAEFWNKMKPKEKK